jgi:hypothetical protein
MDIGLGKGLGRRRRTGTLVNPGGGPAGTLDTIRADLRAAAATTDADSCRRYAWAALDSAISIMADTASTPDQRRDAFDHVQHAHLLLDKADTVPTNPAAGPQ